MSIVFLVFLNLMNPGDSIENMIIQQTPALEGMCVRKDKIAGMLETFGGQCLLILDGLDEHSFGNKNAFQ